MNRIKQVVLTGLMLFVALPAIAVTLEDISPFSAEDLWLIKQAKVLIENNQVDSQKSTVEERDKVHGAIRGMVSSFKDPYTRFVTPEELKEEEEGLSGHYDGIGLVVSERNGAVVAISPIDDTPAFRVGFRANDQIIKVNEEVVVGKSLNDVVKMLRGKAGTKVSVWVRREGEDELLEMPMVREKIRLDSVKYTQLSKNSDVGYIRLSQFIETSSEDVKKAITELDKKGVKGYILDLRNNPGGLLLSATSICDYFLDGGAVVETRGRMSSSNQQYNATHEVLTTKPVVILVNGGSASAAEIVSGCLRDRGRAVLVGEKTFGKGSVQTLFNLNDQSGLYITIARYYTPGGEVIDHVGLQPNIVSKSPEPKPQTAEEREKMKKEQEAYNKLSAPEQKKENDKKWLESLEEDTQVADGVKTLERLIKGETVSELVKAEEAKNDAQKPEGAVSEEKKTDEGLTEEHQKENGSVKK